MIVIAIALLVVMMSCRCVCGCTNCAAWGYYIIIICVWIAQAYYGHQDVVPTSCLVDHDAALQAPITTSMTSQYYSIVGEMLCIVACSVCMMMSELFWKVTVCIHLFVLFPCAPNALDFRIPYNTNRNPIQIRYKFRPGAHPQNPL